MEPELLQYVLDKLSENPDENRINIFTSRDLWSNTHRIFQKFLSNLVPITHLISLSEGNLADINSILSGMGKLRVAKDDVILTKMNRNDCYDNCAKLFIEGKIKELHTGFALSNDGLWKQHSWGVDFNNIIIETIEPCLIYLTSFDWNYDS